jgi:hypothetical protein
VSDKTKTKTQDDKAKPTFVWGVTAREYFDTVQNKPVRVTTVDSKVYSATLVGVDLYDIVLKHEDGTLILMPKHAIKMIAPGNAH